MQIDKTQLAKAAMRQHRFHANTVKSVHSGKETVVRITIMIQLCGVQIAAEEVILQ